MRVMLIVRENDMPPLGSVGDVIEVEDDVGDVLVEFDGHPCPVPPGTGFYVPANWLVPTMPLSQHSVIRELEHA